MHQVQALEPVSKLRLDTNGVVVVIFVVCFFEFAATAPILVLTLRDDTATRDQLLTAACLAVVLPILLVLAANLTARNVLFYEGHFAITRHCWPFRRKSAVAYRQVTRVRASDKNGVTVDLDDGRSFKVADPFMTSVKGALPEVEFKAGAHAAPMLRMRRIARFIELAVEKASAAAE